MTQQELISHLGLVDNYDAIFYDSLYILVIYSTFLTALYYFLSFASDRIFPALHKVNPLKRNQWYNRAVCICHSVFMFGRCIYYFLYINPTFDLTIDVDYFQRNTLFIMIAYLWWDLTVDSWIQIYLANGAIEWDFFIHHILGMISHYHVILADNRCGYFYW